MSNIGQINKIFSFFDTFESNLMINQVNENIGMFYLEVLKFKAQQKNLRLIFDEKDETNISEQDLFNIHSVKIFFVTNTINVKKLLITDRKKIIFTDYKNYKKFYSNVNSINGYNYKEDIDFFLTYILKIANENIKHFCIDNPEQIYSETSKFLVNERNYNTQTNSQNSIQNILKLRKKIYEIKRLGSNIQHLYLTIKEEAKFKKFNFLIY